MKKEKRECVHCGKKFVPTTHRSKYCSEKCYKKHKAILDKSRREKNKKVAISSVNGEKKVAKTVAKEVVKLPPKPAVKVKVIKIKKSNPKEVLIHKDDIVRFVDFSPERVMNFGMRLVKMALDRIHERENKEDKNSCKCTKKVAKKK